MPMSSLSAVAPKVLKELMAVGSISSARVEFADKGLVLVFRLGLNERVLGSARGGLRYFQSLDGAASVLQSYGIVRFDVDTGPWVPRTMMRHQKRVSAETAELEI